MITNELVDKNILFFCVQTFGLESKIADKIRSLGANVTYYDERPKNNNLTKVIIRAKKELYRSKIDSYYQNILRETENVNFDYLLVIRGEVVPEFFLKEIKKANPNIVLIFYNWDSFKNTNHSVPLLRYYDRKFSFDPYDSKNKGIAFRPLYFFDDFRNLTKSTSPDIDLLFLGTAHSDRYIISNTLKQDLEKEGFRMYCFYYMHGRVIYLIKRLFEKSFKAFDYKKLSFKSLTTEDILALYARSNVILDINHPNQTGLTMRTFEAIGAKKKLITTNREVLKMPFYNHSNVLLLDRDNLKFDLKFFSGEYQNVSDELYDKLSIDGWLYNLFVDEEQDFWKKYL
ncbi:glycosyltransferase family protein [Sphingobacterium hungaricum]